MTTAVIDAIHIVISIFLMIIIGMWLTKIGWLNDGNSSLISRLVVKVALPCMIINNMFSYFDRQGLIESMAGVLIPLGTIFLALFLSKFLGAATRVPKERRGVLNCMFSFSNSVFIGVPVTTALFGNEVMPYTLMYYIANTLLFWTVGVAMMRRDGGQQPERGSISVFFKYLKAKAMFFLKKGDNPDGRDDMRSGKVVADTIRRALPLPLVVFFLCVILILMGMRLPSFLDSTTKYVGSMVTPLSLFFIGIIIIRMIRNGNIRWQRGYELVLLGRFIVAPGLIFLCSLIFPIPTMMRNVFIIQAAMPVMSQTSIVAQASNADAEFAAGGTAISTFMSLIFIPLYMAIINII